MVQWPGLGLRGALTFSINNNTIYVVPPQTFTFYIKCIFTKYISNLNNMKYIPLPPCLCSAIEAGDVCSQSRPFWWPRLYPLPVRVTATKAVWGKWKLVNCPPLLHSCLGWKGNRLQWPLADFHTLLILHSVSRYYNDQQLKPYFSGFYSKNILVLVYFSAIYIYIHFFL